MTISVIICTFRKSELLKKSINSILKNSILPNEIILVYREGKEELSEMVSDYKKKFPKVSFKLIYDDNKGLTYARNKGWKNANSNIITYTDDDSYAGKQWIKSIIWTFKKYEKAGIVGGKIIPVYKEVNPNWSIPKIWEYGLPSYTQGNKIGEYVGGNLPPCTNYSIKKSLIKKLNGFNELFGPKPGRKIQIYGEETDLALRVKKLGSKIIYNPSAVVYHPVSLERQTEKYFIDRLTTEGLTNFLIHLVHNRPKYKDLIKDLFSKIRFYLYLKINRKKMDERIYKGQLASTKGYIYGLVKYGFLRAKS